MLTMIQRNVIVRMWNVIQQSEAEEVIQIDKNMVQLPHLEMLDRLIGKSGYKREYIAGYLGISIMSLARKLNGETEFKLSELRLLIKLLNLDDKTVRAIFCPEC
jgi:transcriptional regulator with XRE-family HTH domain